MTNLLLMYSLLFTAFLLATPHWVIQNSGTTARLRGLSAVSNQVAWSSGSGSTVLRTADGGGTWQKLTITTDALDFRDIDAIDSQTAYALSIGNGPLSRIYKTSDAGANWTLQFKNDDPKAFYDSMSFWDANHGIVIGDSIDGQFCIMTTENGGRIWKRILASDLPPALGNEGAFAASGTNIAVFGKTHAWIGTGAASRARVLRTTDRGRTWKVSNTPLVAGSSAGIFSIAFRDTRHGVVVGGDYTKEKEAVGNLAVTTDGGKSWILGKGLSGYRSAVAYVPVTSRLRLTSMLVAVGPSGADYSTDDGRTWKQLEGPGFDTLSFVQARGVGWPIGWAAGAGGSIGKLMFKSASRLLRELMSWKCCVFCIRFHCGAKAKRYTKSHEMALNYACYFVWFRDRLIEVQNVPPPMSTVRQK
ncbi:MAG: WD40/YVTN/BNR-like repeat-containing protein [Pyrinomonadaceae bacterium]